MRFVLAAFAQIMFAGAPVSNAYVAVSEKICLTVHKCMWMFLQPRALLCPRD